MNPRFILNDLRSSIKQWLRSKGNVFWTLMFPVLLILIFGAIFSETDEEPHYEIALQNLDEGDVTGITMNFTKVLEKTPILDIKNVDKDKDITKYMKDEDVSAAIVIPERFGQDIAQGQDIPVDLILYLDPSEQTTSPVIRSIITGLLHQVNMNMTGGENIIGFKEESSIEDDFDYIDFFIPGIIGLTIMTSSIYGSIERNTKFRKNGILRKLLTMPVSRSEWIISKMLFMLFLSFISTVVIILVGILVWGISVKINIFFFIIIIATSFLFSGMGMIIARFVKEEETADMAGGAISFPMMFLAGTFFPLEQMPDFLRHIAQIMPLYYVNEGLRNAMIYDDFDKTIYFSGFVLVFALIFFIIGVLLTKWKED